MTYLTLFCVMTTSWIRFTVTTLEMHAVDHKGEEAREGQILELEGCWRTCSSTFLFTFPREDWGVRGCSEGRQLFPRQLLNANELLATLLWVPLVCSNKVQIQSMVQKELLFLCRFFFLLEFSIFLKVTDSSPIYLRCSLSASQFDTQALR